MKPINANMYVITSVQKRLISFRILTMNVCIVRRSVRQRVISIGMRNSKMLHQKEKEISQRRRRRRIVLVLVIIGMTNLLFNHYHKIVVPLLATMPILLGITNRIVVRQQDKQKERRLVRTATTRTTTRVPIMRN